MVLPGCQNDGLSSKNWQEAGDTEVDLSCVCWGECIIHYVLILIRVTKWETSTEMAVSLPHVMIHICLWMVGVGGCGNCV